MESIILLTFAINGTWLLILWLRVRSLEFAVRDLTTRRLLTGDNPVAPPPFDPKVMKWLRDHHIRMVQSEMGNYSIIGQYGIYRNTEVVVAEAKLDHEPFRVVLYPKKVVDDIGNGEGYEVEVFI